MNIYYAETVYEKNRILKLYPIFFIHFNRISNFFIHKYIFSLRQEKNRGQFVQTNYNIVIRNECHKDANTHGIKNLN